MATDQLMATLWTLCFDFQHNCSNQVDDFCLLIDFTYSLDVSSYFVFYSVFVIVVESFGIDNYIWCLVYGFGVNKL